MKTEKQKVVCIVTIIFGILSLWPCYILAVPMDSPIVGVMLCVMELGFTILHICIYGRLKKPENIFVSFIIFLAGILVGGFVFETIHIGVEAGGKQWLLLTFALLPPLWLWHNLYIKPCA